MLQLPLFITIFISNRTKALVMVKLLSVLICFPFFALSQNVGVGTATPADKLHVFNGNLTVENNLTSYPWISFRSSNLLRGYIGVSADDVRIGTWPGTNTTGHIALVTNSFDRLRVMSNGEVGINTSNPRGLFDVGGGDEEVYLSSSTIIGNQRIAYLPGDIFLSPWAGGNTSFLEARRSDNSGSTNLIVRTTHLGNLRNSLILTSEGRLGINGVTPGAVLEVRQIGQEGLRIRSSNNEVWDLSMDFDINGFPPPNLTFRYNGSSVAYVNRSTGTWNTISDIRLKKDINDVGTVLNRVIKLRPCTYSMINNNPANEQTVGFIAQEVVKLFPDAVIHTGTSINSSSKDLLALNYTALGVYAIKAIQEQQELIEKLMKRVEELEKVGTKK
jgi:Chaperone of endosialidase